MHNNNELFSIKVYKKIIEKVSQFQTFNNQASSVSLFCRFYGQLTIQTRGKNFYIER